MRRGKMAEQMLEKALIEVLNMSLTASVVILAVFVLRLFLKKAPRIFSYALWAVVLFRLLCPVSFPAPLSLLGVLQNRAEDGGRMEYISEDIGYQLEPQVELPVPGVSGPVNQILPEANPHGSVNPMQILLWTAGCIWLLGAAVLLIYSLASLFRLKRKLKGAVREEEGIYRLSGTGTAFVLGLLRPRIYLPEGLEARERRYILLHERIHIRRGDPVFRALSWLALVIHWFNPLVWAAFHFSGRDMEMSCDEAVLKKLGNGVKKEYSASLLSLASGHRRFQGLPLAFGESDTKKRIRNVLRYRRPRRILTAGIAAVCILAAVWLLANPSGTSSENPDLYDGAAMDTETAGETEQPNALETYGIRYQPPSADTFYADMQQVTGLDAQQLLDTYYTLDGAEQWDVSDAAGMEEVQVYTGNIGDGDSGLVFFRDADGQLLAAESAHISRAGWNNIYLGEMDGTGYILTVHIENRYDYGCYDYQVFRLSSSGEILQLAGSSFEWNSNGTVLYQDEYFREWADTLNSYLTDSHLVLSSQEGVLRTQRISEAEQYSYEALRPYDEAGVLRELPSEYYDHYYSGEE